jgi:ectoine hydroxylase-related dioxygenase (phytanoyl-CoA dioxygenase family)
MTAPGTPLPEAATARDQFDLEAYRQQGYAVLRGVLDPAECEQARRESARLMELCGAERDRYAARLEFEVDHLAPEHHQGMDRVIRKIEPISDLSPFFAEMALRPAVAGPARVVCGGEVGLFEDKLNLKLPGGSPYPWHQDWACCWRAHTDELATCFVYLDDADMTNGCLQVIPGSHLGRPVHPFRGGGHFEVDPAVVDASLAVSVPLTAGDMIVFDPYLLHFSDLNRGDVPRRAIIYTYYPARLGAVNQDRFPADGA